MKDAQIRNRDDRPSARESQCDVCDVPGHMIDIGVLRFERQQVLHDAFDTRRKLYLLERRFKRVRRKIFRDLPKDFFETKETLKFSFDIKYFLHPRFHSKLFFAKPADACARSDSTISFTISSNVRPGRHPSLLFAFEASPINNAASFGR